MHNTMDIPAGTYIYGKSRCHDFCPELKLILVLEMTVDILLSKDVVGWIMLSALIIFVIFESKISICHIMYNIIKLRWYFLIIFLMNVYFYDGIISIGIYRGLSVLFRVAAVIMAGAWYTTVTPPVEIIKSFSFIMNPLRFFNIPVRTIAVIFSAAIQFIPTLNEEAENVKKAQIARGVSFENGGMFSNIAAVRSLLIPIFLISFRRADELAIAMESRGFGLREEYGEKVKIRSEKSEMIIFFLLMTYMLSVSIYSLV